MENCSRRASSELESILQINSKEVTTSCRPWTGLPITIGSPTGVASEPPSSPPTETPSTVSVSSSKTGLWGSRQSVLALKLRWIVGPEPTSELDGLKRCPRRRHCPKNSFLVVFCSSILVVGRHLQENQPLSSRKLNFPDRLVLLQPLHRVPSHR